ncbi:MAG TPA: LPS export ABC transporter periplasmic protein LptC [Ferruginibacter sp.]|nr:LPS export ABC transporter periplasmic protein LptC [Ferruginibacter sp.]
MPLWLTHKCNKLFKARLWQFDTGLRKDKISILFFYTTFFVLALFTSSCGNSDAEIDQYNQKSLGIEEIKNADINYTIAGKPKAKLTSPLMLRVQQSNPYVEFPKTLHVDFFNENGEIDSRLDAHYGKYFEQESKVFLKDSVRVINTQGDTLYCNELWWDRNRIGREFYTDKPVRIRKKMEVTDGTGMEAAQNFKNWVILNPSKGVMKIPASQFPDN